MGLKIFLTRVDHIVHHNYFAVRSVLIALEIPVSVENHPKTTGADTFDTKLWPMSILSTSSEFKRRLTSVVLIISVVYRVCTFFGFNHRSFVRPKLNKRSDERSHTDVDLRNFRDDDRVTRSGISADLSRMPFWRLLDQLRHVLGTSLTNTGKDFGMSLDL
jgi:hypothetical protein